jgi:hypothetical protein
VLYVTQFHPSLNFKCYLLSRATLKDDMKVHVDFKKKFGCESMQYTKIWLVEELLMYTLGLILKQVFESNFSFVLYMSPQMQCLL